MIVYFGRSTVKEMFPSGGVVTLLLMAVILLVMVLLTL